MNFEIFNNPDPSGMMSREKYVSKFFTEEYDYIINYCNDRGIDAPFKEKVYITINNLDNIPKCKNNNCNNIVKYKNSTIGYLHYCSNKCISSDPNIKKHKEKLSFEKFGTKTPAESKEIKNKIIKTNQKRYGANSAMCNIETQEKSKKTLIENYGVNNPSKSLEIVTKRVESFKENIEQYKESYKKTSMEKYGVEHPWMNKEIHNKTIDFFYYDYKNRIEEKLKNFDKYSFIDFTYNPTTINIKCLDCNQIFKILPYQFYGRIKRNFNICTNCYPIENSSSLPQMEIENFIKDNYSGDISINDKQILNPYEVDIYLPNLKIGFEFNGLYWHSDKYRDRWYHYKKAKLAQENGIQLISIWEDDWLFKEEIVKSFILNKIGKSNRIYARKCLIKEISYKESMKFLNENHLQGDIKSPIRIGLFNNELLVGLMTFSKLRLPLSQKNKENSYELTRFCNKCGYTVVGGASKLLKYFIDKFKPFEIQSYSDNNISNGSLYKNLGFEYSHTSDPGYWYVINEKREHRFNWRKSKLVKMGYDPIKTEDEIMLELGHYRIWNAGNKKWVLNI